jgi:hypothetical protein
MLHYLPLRFFRLILCLIVFIICSHSSYGQTSSTTGVKYIRVDIGHGGLHCPFLGPRFEQSVKALEGVQNVKIYQRESYATFELPATPTVSESQLKEVVVKVGYPVADVTITLSDNSIQTPASQN